MDLERIAVIEAIPHRNRYSTDGFLITEPVDVSNFRSAEINIEFGSLSSNKEDELVDEAGEDTPPSPGGPDIPELPEPSGQPDYIAFQWQVAYSDGNEEYDWMDYGDPVMGREIDDGEYIRLAVFIAAPLLRMKIDRFDTKVSIRSAKYILGGPHLLPHDKGIPLTVVPHNHGNPIWVRGRGFKHKVKGTFVKA